MMQSLSVEELISQVDAFCIVLYLHVNASETIKERGLGVLHEFDQERVQKILILVGCRDMIDGLL